MIKFLGLSTLFEIVGSSIQGFSTKSLLIALPPALAFAAVLNWALSPAVPLSFRGIPDTQFHWEDILYLSQFIHSYNKVLANRASGNDIALSMKTTITFLQQKSIASQF